MVIAHGRRASISNWRRESAQLKRAGAEPAQRRDWWAIVNSQGPQMIDLIGSSAAFNRPQCLPERACGRGARLPRIRSGTRRIGARVPARRAAPIGARRAKCRFASCKQPFFNELETANRHSAGFALATRLVILLKRHFSPATPSKVVKVIPVRNRQVAPR